MRDDHVAVLLEDIQGTVQKLAESVSALHEDNLKIHEQLDTITDIVTEVPVTKAVVIDNSDRIDGHERRITKLEAAT